MGLSGSKSSSTSSIHLKIGPGLIIRSSHPRNDTEQTASDIRELRVPFATRYGTAFNIVMKEGKKMNKLTSKTRDMISYREQ